MLASCLPVRVWPRFGHLLVWSTFETFLGTCWSLSVGVVLAFCWALLLVSFWPPVGLRLEKRKKRKDGGSVARRRREREGDDGLRTKGSARTDLNDTLTTRPFKHWEGGGLSGGLSIAALRARRLGSRDGDESC